MTKAELKRGDLVRIGRTPYIVLGTVEITKTTNSTVSKSDKKRIFLRLTEEYFESLNLIGDRKCVDDYFFKTQGIGLINCLKEADKCKGRMEYIKHIELDTFYDFRVSQDTVRGLSDCYYTLEATYVTGE